MPTPPKPSKPSSWRTTLAGILGLTTTGFAIYSNPASITNPAIMAALATSIGLIAAKDHQSPPDEPTPAPDPDELADLIAFRKARAERLAKLANAPK